MKKGAFILCCLCGLILTAGQALSQILDSGWYHIRNSDPREWTEFPQKAEKRKLQIIFATQPNTAEQTLSLRQYDIKLNWRLILNGHVLGALAVDEKDLLSYFRISPRMLKTENTLEITCVDAQPDDIRVGQIALHKLPLQAVLTWQSVVRRSGRHLYDLRDTRN
jgi:hypothetical protein